jgi:signal transduction histidine kinase
MFLTRRLNLARQQGDQAANHDALITLSLTILERCNQSLRRMAQLVNDMLDDARVQQGQLTVQLERGDLAHLVASVVEEQRLLAGERRIDLDLPPAQPVMVLLDPDRIAQVVVNYLSNALKYSGEERPVLTCLAVVDGEARVSVHDEGVGVPPAAEAHIWERFYRVDGVKVQSGSGIGLGIGLHVSKAIVEAHHGHVGIERNSGPGSTFWFTLPLCVDPDH